MMKLKTLLGVSALSLSMATMAADVTFDIDAGRRTTRIGDLHYGIFFEEINHAGDGGLYAELVRNRSFEDRETGYWSHSNGVDWEICQENNITEAQLVNLKVNFGAAGEWIANEGFWGMNIKQGDPYTLNFFSRSDSGYNGIITASLMDGDKVIGSADVQVIAGNK